MHGTVRLSEKGILLPLCIAATIAALVALSFAQSAHAEEPDGSTGLIGAHAQALNNAVATQSALNGWVEKNNSSYYYRDGTMLTGYQQIDGKYYYFRPNGKLCNEDFEFLWHLCLAI